MSKAYRVTISSRSLRRRFGLWGVKRWGSEGGIGHTACRHYRLGPFVLHVYEVKP